MATPPMWLWSGVRRCFQHRRTPLLDRYSSPLLRDESGFTVYLVRRSAHAHFDPIHTVLQRHALRVMDARAPDALILLEAQRSIEHPTRPPAFARFRTAVWR